MSKPTHTNFNEWLNANLVNEKLLKLPEVTGISKSRLTRLIKNPETASILELVLIASALDKPIHYLISDFNFGGAAHLFGFDPTIAKDLEIF